jgi:C-terminal processing protease CtpA/Prc
MQKDSAALPDDDRFNGIDWHHAEPLPTFLARAPVLTLDERLAIVDEAASLLARHYAHLPQKRADHGIDPSARLRALHRMLTAQEVADGPGDLGFHAALCAVFAELRDLHTLYLLPKTFAASVAFLPFQIGLPAEGGVIVTQVLDGFGHRPFRPGVELLAWSGVPIARAIARVASISGGANPAAARGRAVAAMTQRPMLRMAPPDEAWVELDFRDDGAVHNLRVAWKVCPQQAEPAAQTGHGANPGLSIDAEGDALRRHRKASYAAHVLRAERSGVAPEAGTARDGHPFEVEIPTAIGDLRAWSGRVGDRRFGVLRLRSFKVTEDAFLAEIQRLLALLPPEGLIIDLRDNPGGLVAAAERMLQYLTPRQISPVGVQFLATPENLALCRAQTPANPAMRVDLSPWIASLEAAQATGAAWSDALPMTPPGDCNDTGRLYPGPVVLITSARCYSAADIFIAGFRDHAIGPILGIDANTGAGGANMWTARQIDMLTGQPDSPLPGQAELRVAIRRVQRSGDGSGLVLEEAGIVPDHIHTLTRSDLLQGDAELIAQAVALLAGQT